MKVPHVICVCRPYSFTYLMEKHLVQMLSVDDLQVQARMRGRNHVPDAVSHV